jgi:hypothetical protein
MTYTSVIQATRLGVGLGVIALTALALAACGGSASEVKNILQGGNFQGNSAQELALSRQANADTCCGVTLDYVGHAPLVAQAFGCGKVYNYEFLNNTWSQVSNAPIDGHGSAADLLPNCTPKY